MAYAGSKAIGVNPYSKNMVAAVELAVYLGSAEAQMSHYKLRNVIPCNTCLLYTSNAKEAGVDHLIHFQERAVKDLRHPTKYGFIITCLLYTSRCV